MESALRPNRFIHYRNSWEFVEGLERVEEQIDRVVKNQPARAVELLETFIAGCYEKAEEIDDSSGSFGQFVESLFCLWIKARQAAKGDPREIIKQLLNWMSDDNYGFCYGIEKEAVKALNKAGLEAFAEIAHEEWTHELDHVRVREKGDKMTPGSFRFRWLSDVLRAIYAEQRDLDRYLAIAEEIGLTPLATAKRGTEGAPRSPTSPSVQARRRADEATHPGPSVVVRGSDSSGSRRGEGGTPNARVEPGLRDWQDPQNHERTIVRGGPSQGGRLRLGGGEDQLRSLQRTLLDPPPCACNRVQQLTLVRNDGATVTLLRAVLNHAEIALRPS